MGSVAFRNYAGIKILQIRQSMDGKSRWADNFDEFGNMPVMDNFGGMVTNCLGAGMAFNIFIQSYSQLSSNYDMDEDTIKDNFANQVYILQAGEHGGEEFSRQLGNKTVVEVQRSGTALSLKKTVSES